MAIQPKREHGFAAIWVAITLLFLLATAALAVDVSGFQETARTDQTTADLACLAGVPYLPGAAGTARAAAAENVQRNFPLLASATSTTAGNTLTLTDGAGNTAAITSPVGGDGAKLQVVITETDVATFGRVIGQSQVPVTQEAFCKVFSGSQASIPFGTMPGGSAGQLQIQDGSTGNYHQLFILRQNVSGVGPTLEENIAFGIDHQLTIGDIVPTDTGQSGGPFKAGFDARLQNECAVSGNGKLITCGPVSQVLGGNPQTLGAALGSQPAWWNVSLYGPWASASSNHFYWDQVIANCQSMRLAQIPIVAPTTWSVGDPTPTWPPGKKDDVKVVGFYSVIITDANFQGQTHVANGRIIWFGPNARCVGPNGSTTPFTTGSIKTYRLVDPGA